MSDNQLTIFPWQAIYGLRNIISHEYANIDADIIVSVINDNIAPLITSKEELLKKYLSLRLRIHSTCPN